MSEHICLRCDWIGEDAVATCPRCEAPLFRSHGSEEPPEGELPDEPASPFVAATATGRRWVAVVLGLAVAAAGTTFVLVSRPSQPSAGPASPTSGVVASPAVSDRPSPSAGPSREVLSACTGQADRPTGPEQPPFGSPPADALTAEYRFQGTLASSVGNAPTLRQIPTTTARFRAETVAGERRTVLRFRRGSGLELVPTAGVSEVDGYTIELLFRLDRLDGYRKIVDFADASEDCGLYDFEGRLDFYAAAEGRPGRIALGEYVHVVLTREASSRVVGYVDGDRQFAFLDSQGIAAIGPADALRFFADDETTGGEDSAGAVSLVRLYDRPLSGIEVADLVCGELGGPACT